MLRLLVMRGFSRSLLRNYWEDATLPSSSSRLPFQYANYSENAFMPLSEGSYLWRHSIMFRLGNLGAKVGEFLSL